MTPTEHALLGHQQCTACKDWHEKEADRTANYGDIIGVLCWDCVKELVDHLKSKLTIQPSKADHWYAMHPDTRINYTQPTSVGDYDPR